MPAEQVNSKMEETVEKPTSLVARGTNALSLAVKHRALVATAASTAVKYYTVGPLQESWDLQTAVILALLRKSGGSRGNDPDTDMARAMKAARKRVAALEQHNPKNGVCAEVEIPVRKSGLKGVLEKVDAKEDGSRTVPAEWQWHNDVRGKATDKVVLYFHGGGHTVMNPRTHRGLTLLISKSLNARIFSVDYALAPEGPFPSALHDAVAAFLYLTDDLKIPAKSICVAGDSAGGNLAMALMLYLRDEKMQQVGSALLISPWVDLSISLGSWDSNADFDYLAFPSGGRSPVHMYLGELYDTHITHPYVSSAIADLSSLPPMLVQVGGSETLRDEGTLLAQRAALAGVDVQLQHWGHGTHVAQAFVSTPLSIAAIKAMGEWNKEQAEAEHADFSSIDKLLEAAWETRRVKAEKKGEPIRESVQQVTQEPAWIFDGVKKDAPEIVLRSNAHEDFKKAVEELKGARATNVTTIFEPRRNPAAPGVIGKVRGMLHL